MKNIFIFLLFSLFLFFPITSSAQIDSLVEGSKIRVTLHQNFYKPIIGTFNNFKLNAISILIADKEITFPNYQIQKIEILKGMKRETFTGAVVGSILGGFILGIILNIENQNSEGFSKIGLPSFWGGFAAGALIGGGVGGVIGYNTKNPVWQEIKISKQFNL